LKLKIDLHVHTIFSSDAFISPTEIVLWAKRRGLDGVAVTDHDCFESAVKIAQGTDFLIIPGMEISSRHGHIVGLNVQEKIPKGLGSDESVDRIHAVGGLAIACHPIAFLKGSLGEHATSKFDAIEVINSSAFPFAYCKKRSEELASRLKIPRIAGTDAHCAPEIGYAFTLIDAEPNINSVLDAIKNGKCWPHGGAIPFSLRLRREFRKLQKLTSARGVERREIAEQSA
jgi:predicted metal-dependent phosphoesterase TrpH